MVKTEPLINQIFGLFIQWFPPLVLVGEIVLSALIIHKIAYTEIDWIAYMQEVKGFIDGERNYLNMQGDTGPLVYPAAFVYIFSLLYRLTDDGRNILAAQYIFAVLYLITQAVVLSIYGLQARLRLPWWLVGTLALSKRVHSIFMLRMFNDCIAVLFGYCALRLFLATSLGTSRFRWGCALYSLGVGVKMNMLLWAPGVLLVLLLATGVRETIVCLSICGGLQILLGLPFLTTFPVEYVSRAFDLGRVFMHKWTVNFKFLSEDVFISKQLSLLLLALTVFAYLSFGFKWVHEVGIVLSYLVFCFTVHSLAFGCSILCD